MRWNIDMSKIDKFRFGVRGLVPASCSGGQIWLRRRSYESIETVENSGFKSQSEHDPHFFCWIDLLSFLLDRPVSLLKRHME